MPALLRDVRYAVRLILKNPTFSFVAILTIALGVGANTAVFSVINGILLRPLSFREPERLVAIQQKNDAKGWSEFQVSFPDFIDWRQQHQTFEDMAAYRETSFTLSGDDEPERIQGAFVTASFFQTLGVNPILGRTFTADDEQQRDTLIVVIGEGLWRTRFGADPNEIARDLRIEGRPCRVIGVMPASLEFPSRSTRAWTLLSFDPARFNRGNHILNVIARLKPGSSLNQGVADMESIAQRLSQTYPDSRDWGTSLKPLKKQIVGDIQFPLLVLQAAVAFVLLITCVNVANLLLSRAAARRKEISIRAAIGASRGRLLRQLLTESALLALTGGVLGLLFAGGAVRGLISMGVSLPRIHSISVDAKVLGFTLIVSVLTAIGFGLAPAVQISRSDLSQLLKDSSTSSFGIRGSRYLRRFLIASQVALALIPLICAGLMIKSFSRLLAVQPGFDPQRVLVLGISLPRARYGQAQQQSAFFQQFIESVEQLEGVRSAGATSALPFGGSNSNISLSIEGQPALPSGQELTTSYSMVTPHYFRSMGIRVLEGREFTQADVDGAPLVAVINETMARRFWPDQSPAGKHLTIAYSNKPAPREIVGVVADVRHMGFDSAPQPAIFLPSTQLPAAFMSVTVLTNREPEQLAGPVRAVLREIDKDLPAVNLNSMNEIMAESVSARRVNVVLTAIFAALALILAMVGIWGVVSNSVTQRSREIGIRMAMGAQRGHVLKMVLSEVIILTLVGIGIGLPAAWALTRFIRSLLFEVAPADPAIFAVIPALLILAGLVASYIPARRATRIDPAITLRSE